MKNSLISLAILLSLNVSAQSRNGDNWRARVDSLLNATMKKYPTSGRAKIVSYSADKNSNKLSLRLSDSFANIPHRKSSIDSLYAETKKMLPANLAKLDLVMTVEGKDLGYYIPNALRKVRAKDKSRMLLNPSHQPALVRNKSLPYKITEGLEGNHIALWQSHGLYFERKLDRWEWQRARYFQTVEDLFTQSFVLPYLVPMLENAGAVTILPRERDINTTEFIIDKDNSSENCKYIEVEGKEKWKPGTKGGFAHIKSSYVDGENPFDMGDYRYVMSTTHKEADSKAMWKAEITDPGEYAVYVSYKSLPASPTDALYTVHHAGGKTEFKVNQRMGGNTWVYLGTFPFKPGDPQKSMIALSNFSKEANRIVSADAVKIGGGMGNIARSTQKVKLENGKVLNASDIQGETSGMPRFTEGARYWMQWAGIPYKVYSPKNGDNDYIDDFSSRGAWVNYLSGGSRVLPDSAGLNIPIDLAFAFHSDAGTSMTDSIVGTLGIYYTKHNKGKYADGTSRMAARDLTDIIQSEIIEDVRTQFDPDFTRRAMWNKSYSEARVGEVPTMLLELLSHQNLADMRYGLDPRFRFTVSRAIYKGMLKFIASRENKDYVVQPLPVNSFSCTFAERNKIELSWEPTFDSSEPTAKPTKYIIYTRIDNGAFNQGKVVESTAVQIPVETGHHYDFKVAALNAGGVSFPSEILSAYQAPNSKGVMLIVNGFNRVSAPGSFATKDSTFGGFMSDIDFGVPDHRSIDYIGKQYEFRRSEAWVDDDNPGFGASYNDFAGKPVAGNTFDYPSLHGRSIAKAGMSYVSVSDEVFMNPDFKTNSYKIVDLILGKEREIQIGKGSMPNEFQVFSLPMQEAVKRYISQGGNVLVSGAYVGTDIWNGLTDDPARRSFAEKQLKYTWRTDHASIQGSVKAVSSPMKLNKSVYTFYNEPNKDFYSTESPDGIEPSSKEAFTFMRYTDSNVSAAIAYPGKNYRTIVLGFPFETIRLSEDRDQLMIQLINFLLNK